MAALDRIDFEIIDALQNNARESNKELAGRVGLSPSSCLQRVRRLTDEGVLLGYHAEVGAAALGIGLQAMLFVRLRRHSRDAVKAFRTYALALREVVALYNVSGAEDFLVHVVARDAAHLFVLARDSFTARGEVDHLQTSLIFDMVRRPTLPNLVETPPRRPRAQRRERT
jgi:DNA-binding Lrp family transcriptional regulator